MAADAGRSERIALDTGPAAPAAAEAEVVLEVDGLTAEYRSRRETVVAARDISFTVEQRGCVALVGESGSGKTTIAPRDRRAAPDLRGRDPARRRGAADSPAARTVEQRRRIQIVFQNPAEALNPRHTVAASIGRPAQILQRHEPERMRGRGRAGCSSRCGCRRGIGVRYPRELSGGERQRVAIARALAAGPELLICDEITSALDVSVQAVVLELLRELRQELGVSVVFITHDLGVVATIADQRARARGRRHLRARLDQ